MDDNFRFTAFGRILEILIVLTLFSPIYGKIDNITLENDARSTIDLVSFGMYEQAFMRVSGEIEYNGENTSGKKYFGFTLDKTRESSNHISNLEERNIAKNQFCALDVDLNKPEHKDMILLWISENNKNTTLRIEKASGVADVVISTGMDTTVSAITKSNKDQQEKKDNTKITTTVATMASSTSVASDSAMHSRRKRDANQTMLIVPVNVTCGSFKVNRANNGKKFTFEFYVHIVNEADQGMYTLYFHNCRTDAKAKETKPINTLNVTIIAKNRSPESYLSAGQIPEPYVYFCVCVTYFALSFVWIKVLRSASSGVFKTHYLMLTVLYCKSLSGLFHGVNYLYISRYGKEETAWAVIYYITYLMKTLMLFLTLLLVGTGWSFVKHIFSDKEKKVFLVAIPFQLLAYIAFVITGETEVATKNWNTWHALSILVDILCSVTILAPVYWSIKHLTDASRTDGKAAINLQKLQLFRALYALIICNIYITKIVIYIIRITLPFQLEWLGDMLTESSVLVFLLIVGYKFRPADDNPYFQVPPDSDDEEAIEMPVTQSGVNSTKRRVLVNAEDETEQQSLLSSRSGKNESSHELD